MSDDKCPYMNIIIYLENLINYKKSYGLFSKKPELHEACSNIMLEENIQMYNNKTPIDNLSIKDLDNLLVRFKYLYDEYENSKDVTKKSQYHNSNYLINSNRSNYGIEELKRQYNVNENNKQNLYSDVYSNRKRELGEEMQRQIKPEIYNANQIKDILTNYSTNPRGGKRKSKRRKSKKTTNKKGKKNRKSTRKSNKKLSKK